GRDLAGGRDRWPGPLSRRQAGHVSVSPRRDCDNSPAPDKRRRLGPRSDQQWADWLAQWGSANAQRKEWPAVRWSQCDDLRRPGEFVAVHELCARKVDAVGVAEMDEPSRRQGVVAYARRPRWGEYRPRRVSRSRAL